MMKQRPAPPTAKPVHTAPPQGDARKLAQVAENKEVVGRHKNDGQKGHKGAR